MPEFTIVVPDDKVEEVINALCDSEFEEATAIRAKQSIIDWIKGKVLSERSKASRESVNIDDLGLG